MFSFTIKLMRGQGRDQAGRERAGHAAPSRADPKNGGGNPDRPNFFTRVIEIASGIALAVLSLTFFSYIYWAHLQSRLEVLTRPIVRNEVTVKITTKEKQLLDALATKGAISTPPEVLGQVISFYDTQNAFLLGIMGLSGIFGYFFIRQRTRKETESLLKAEFETFTKTIDFQTHVNSIVSNSANVIELGKTADDLYVKLEKLTKLEEKSEDKLTAPTSTPTPAAPVLSAAAAQLQEGE
jgi:hypothetical protein